jgi:hypothetical protein
LNRFRHRAQLARRSVEDEVRLALEATLVEIDQPLDDLAPALEALDRLATDQLWALVRSRAASEEATVLAALNDKRQAQGLTAAETTLAHELSGRYDRAVLLRAKALALLHQRGVDVRPLVDGA